jgi:predicted nucleic acid-binding protein
MPDDAWRFVERVQDELVDLGQHKGPSVVDLLGAATAEAWGLTVLHVDADFETIARVAPIKVRRADHP